MLSASIRDCGSERPYLRERMLLAAAEIVLTHSAFRPQQRRKVTYMRRARTASLSIAQLDPCLQTRRFLPAVAILPCFAMSAFSWAMAP